jgi:hypothetical protein
MNSRLVPPTFMPGMPWDHPGITSFSEKLMDWPVSLELWNMVPVDATAPV